MRFFWYLKSFDWYLRQLPPADQRIFYGRICRRLKRLQLKKEDFARAPLPAGEAGKLLTFWQWLKQRDFDRCRQLNVYFCGVLLYRIKTRPDGSRSDHLLFGALPFFPAGGGQCKNKSPSLREGILFSAVQKAFVDAADRAGPVVRQFFERRVSVINVSANDANPLFFVVSHFISPFCLECWVKTLKLRF